MNGKATIANNQQGNKEYENLEKSHIARGDIFYIKCEELPPLPLGQQFIYKYEESLPLLRSGQFYSENFCNKKNSCS